METALRLYRAIDHVEGQVETLMLKGRLEEDRSDYPNAKSLYATAIEFANTRGLRAREAEAHFDFSRVLSTEGDHVGSLERKMRALELAEGIADWHLQARFQVSLGANLIELRRYEEARMAYDRAIETARRIGDLRMLAYGVFNAARARISRGDLQQGEAYLKESEALFRKLREPVMTGLVLASYGALWEKRGKWQLAKHYLLTGLDSLRQGAHDFDFARNAQVAAFYFHKHGDRESALALLDEALTVSQRLQLPSLAEGIQSVMNDFAQRLVVPTGARPMLEGRYRTT